MSMLRRRIGAIARTPRVPACYTSVKGYDMPKGEAVEVDALVVDALPNTQFKVRLEGGHEALAYTSGKMRRFRVRILLGDKVKVELSPYDLTRGRITYRYRS